MKNYFLIAATALLAVTHVSCGDKGGNEPEVFAGVYYDERMSDREYIEKVANTVMGFIKPGEQQEAINALYTFTNLCETYDMPDNFKDHPSGELARSIAEALEADDYMSASRAANTYVYNLARFKGMYQANPDSYVWSRIEDRDDLLFRYWKGSTEYNVTLSGSGVGLSTTVTDGGDKYAIEVPGVLDFTIIRGSLTNPTTILSVKIKTDMRDGESVKCYNTMRVGSMQIDLNTSGNNTTITEDITLYRHDPSSLVRTLLMSSTNEIKGSNLCSIQAWKNAADKGDATTMLSSLTSTTMLYGSVQVKANVKSVKTLVDNTVTWWDTEAYDNPKELAQKAASGLTAAVTADVRYYSDSPDKVRATLGWEAYQSDDWAEYQQWEVRPTITFLKDNSTYDFGSYFGNSHFLSVENVIKSTINAYKSYWK